MENVVVLKSASEMRKIATDLRNEEIAKRALSVIENLKEQII